MREKCSGGKRKGLLDLRLRMRGGGSEENSNAHNRLDRLWRGGNDGNLFVDLTGKLSRMSWRGRIDLVLRREVRGEKWRALGRYGIWKRVK